MKRLAWTLLVSALLIGKPLWADGGQVLARGDSGPFGITLFVSPSPPAAGTADFSLLVQKRGETDAVLDAEVTMRLRSAGETTSFRLTREAAQNKLLYAAQVAIPRPGAWNYEVTVTRGGEGGSLAGSFFAAAAAPGISAYWLCFALPVAGVLVFLLRRRLLHQRLSAAD